ncbi:MAG: glutamine synthetase, partial [Bdellovibrionales bacterium RBG_16_40_8]
MAQSLAEKIKGYKSRGIERIKFAITDVDGILRGKYISLEKFESVLKNGGGFCDCVFGWDVNDQLYDNTSFTGWHTAYPDALCRIDRSTERFLPDEKIPFFLAEFVTEDGRPDHPVCPRQAFKRILKKAEEMGFGCNLAFEYEFFLFNETPQSALAKNYQNLTPFTPGMFGYSVIRSSTHSDLFCAFMDYCSQMNFSLEGLHCETGPGVWEAAIRYDLALNAVDKAILLKTFTKVFFQKRGILPTFMARWNLNLPGQSGHIHQSLFDLKSNKPLFYDKNKDHNISTIMEHYVAGQIKYLKSFLALTSPTINSYTRLVKGFWAPTASTWGVENRTTALRVISGSEKSQRVEFRVGSADANPYIAAAAMIGAGLLGIEQKLKLEKPITGSAYAVQDKLNEDRQFPTNLRSSIENLRKSKEARILMGKEFIEHFIK